MVVLSPDAVGLLSDGHLGREGSVENLISENRLQTSDLWLHLLVPGAPVREMEVTAKGCTVAQPWAFCAGRRGWTL